MLYTPFNFTPYNKDDELAALEKRRNEELKKKATVIPKSVLQKAAADNELKKLEEKRVLALQSQQPQSLPSLTSMRSSSPMISSDPGGVQTVQFAKDFATSLPQSTLDVSQSIGQSSMRAYGALAGELTGNYLTPQTQFQKDLYGTDKPISFRSVAGEIGVPEQSILAPAVGAALSAGDLFGSSKPYKNIGNLSTKLLSKLAGRTTVSKQFISDLTNSPDLKQPERDLFRKILSGEGETINVPDFANKVKSELLPLKRSGGEGFEVGSQEGFENITLPDNLRGPVADYSEHIYESPIKTSAGNVHYSADPDQYPNYFAHTRIEDLPDKTTRRVIEAQSDLFQKGRLEGEKIEQGGVNSFTTGKPAVVGKFSDGYAVSSGNQRLSPFFKTEAEAKNALKDVIVGRQAELSKLEPYRNTWHERIIREEVKQAAKDGKTKLQFPTGETAMKIEGLGDNSGGFTVTDLNSVDLTPNNIKVGYEIEDSADVEWIITDVLGDGKFKAVPKKEFERVPEEELESWTETFDISGKVDQNNPIYKFYEKEVGRYLANKYGAKRIKDARGVEWYEIDLSKDSYAAKPVEAFAAVATQQDEEGNFKFDPLAATLGVLGVAALRKIKLPPSVQEKLLQYDIAKDALLNNPARQLAKFANRNGELPEVLGSARTAHGLGAKSKFGIAGDSIVTELGFETSEQARDAYQVYRKQAANLERLAQEIKEETKALRETQEVKVRQMKTSQEIPSLERSAQEYLATTRQAQDIPPTSGSKPPTPPRSAPAPVNVSLPETSTGRKLSTARKLVTGGERILRESGPSGTKMAQLMEKQRVAQDLLTGEYNVEINNALKGLSKAEKLEVTAVLEGGTTVNEKVKTAAQKVREMLNRIAKRAEQEKFEMRTPAGGTVPFKAREDYFPRMYNWDALAKGKRRDEAIKHLVETGQARNLSEAENLLNIMMENAQRRAGNLENPRLLDLPGYEMNPEKALKRYAGSVAKRFTEAEYFGKKDERVADLINKIANEAGDYKEAQRIFDFQVDGPTKNALVSAITQFNVVTKLSLSAIINATQSINTATKAGALNTAKGIWKGFTTKGKEIAELTNAYDDFIVVKEGGFEPAKLVRGVMYIFKTVENFNRRTAANVGYLRTQQLVNDLRKNPESKYAVRQLESLGLDIEKVIKGDITEKDLLGAANMMIQKTQFKVDPLDVPPSWKTPVGRLLTQFKSFSFMQTKFVRDEIIKEARHGNLVPLVTFVSLAIPASYVVSMVRNALTGREQDSPDIREWDKWMRAFGTIPTEILIQAKFLKDTAESDFLTPLQKGARVAGTIAGPTADEVGKFLAGVENIRITEEKNKEYLRRQGKEEDPYKQLKRQAIEKIPFVGQYLKNTLYPYQKSTKTQEEKDINALMYDIIDKANSKDYNDSKTKDMVVEYIQKLPESERSRQLYVLRENGVNVEGISSSNYKTKFNLDSKYKEYGQNIYDKIQSFNPSKGWTKAEKAARDNYLNTLSQEERTVYEEYKEWQASEKAKATKAGKSEEQTLLELERRRELKLLLQQ